MPMVKGRGGQPMLDGPKPKANAGMFTIGVGVYAQRIGVDGNWQP